VDIASIARSIKSAHVAEHGLPHSSRFFAHLHAWAEWASGKHRMVNFLIHRGLFRWLAERTWGISRHRRLPPLAKVEFLRWAKDAGHSNETPHDGRPRVALFVDTYVRFHDPRVGIAAVRVLSQLGFAVHVPSQQTQSGMAPLHYGDEESARLAIRANLDVLAPLVREGHAIVCLEPSSALILRQDALSLMNDEEAHIVAASTFEFCEFLGEHAELLESALAQVGETTAQSSLPLGGTIAYHEPCHQKALEPKHPTMEVLQHIPGPTWLPVELGCTGMAGTFGMSANGYHPSMRAGKALFDRISMPDVDYGATQCSTCRLQLEHATKKQVLHPAIWHALALGVGADLVTLKQRKSTK
jgi:Fe-S oxidoreductase